jgi:hypothetical protein
MYALDVTSPGLTLPTYSDFIKMVSTTAVLYSHTSNCCGFLAVLVQNMVAWVVTPYSLVCEYQRFGDICCLHLQGRSVFTTDKGSIVKSFLSLQLTV